MKDFANKNTVDCKEKTYIWYACYGSNLDKNRFRCYIEGGDYNKREYEGCEDKSIWISEDHMIFPGRMYFAKNSSTWENQGVAFYNPDEEGNTYMKLYKITEDQLSDIQLQECCSGRRTGKILCESHWYSKRICLGQHKDGCLIYTITCNEKYEESSPCGRYLDVIWNGLEVTFGNDIDVLCYLKDCLKKLA